jgi:hypothetical protein
MSGVLVTNDAGSGLDERVYLLLIQPVITCNYSAIVIYMLSSPPFHTHYDSQFLLVLF